VNKIEVDLFVPKDYSYWSFSGTLHFRDAAYSNTLAWLTGVDARPVAGYGGQFKMPPQPLGQFPTEGRMLCFETLAPVAEVNFSYCGNKLVVFLDVVLALLAIAVGVVLVRVLKRSRLWVGLGCVLIPLLMMWYVTGDAEEPWAAAATGGGLLAAALLLVALKQWLHDWREMRIRTAPDPFLEEAPEKPSPAETDEGTEDGGQKSEVRGQKKETSDASDRSEKSDPSDTSDTSDTSDKSEKSDPSDKPDPSDPTDPTDRSDKNRRKKR
jgi:hypothetical protein